MNKQISLNSLNGDGTENVFFLNFIEKAILTTTNTLNISDQLGITHEEALIIHELAIKHQINFNLREKLPMPSYECMMTIKPDFTARENISLELSSVTKEYLSVPWSTLTNKINQSHQYLKEATWLLKQILLVTNRIKIIVLKKCRDPLSQLPIRRAQFSITITLESMPAS